MQSSADATPSDKSLGVTCVLCVRILRRKKLFSHCAEGTKLVKFVPAQKAKVTIHKNAPRNCNHYIRDLLRL